MKYTLCPVYGDKFKIKTPYTFSFEETDALKYILESLGAFDVYVYRRIGEIKFKFDGEISPVLNKLKSLKFSQLKDMEIKDASFIPAEKIELFDILRDSFQYRLFVKFVLPYPVRTALTLFKSLKYVFKAFKNIIQLKLNVEVLDGVAIASSVLEGKVNSASSIIFLLGMADKIEDWTVDKSDKELKSALSLNIDKVWVLNGERRELKSLKEVQKEEKVEFLTGSVIAVDGTVFKGEAMINQSSLTGESQAVHKTVGDYCFAGTVVEDGSIIITTDKKYDDSRLSDIIKMLKNSEQNKALSCIKSEKTADKLVKFNFLGAFLTYLFTRNIEKTTAFFVVDYSCALRLVIPIAVMSAITQSFKNKVWVKGGRSLETLSLTDTAVFDKTGTLTGAEPVVTSFINLSDNLSDEKLIRMAACIEEHFPHPIASAVSAYAIKKGVYHKGEHHSKPEYIIAHGIVAEYAGMRVVIGSEHFVVEDEHVKIDETLLKKIKEENDGKSLLFIGTENELIGIFTIEDPIRTDAEKLIFDLRKLGYKKISMLTGDAEVSALKAARELKLDEFRSQYLPDQKAEYINELKENGYKVLMVGDGVNDSVALSSADVSMAMSEGSDISKEIADITVNSNDLSAVTDTIKISRAMARRISYSYSFILGFNSFLMGLGALGAVNSKISSLLHNTSTVFMALNNMKNYDIR